MVIDEVVVGVGEQRSQGSSDAVLAAGQGGRVLGLGHAPGTSPPHPVAEVGAEDHHGRQKDEREVPPEHMVWIHHLMRSILQLFLTIHNNLSYAK